MVEVPVTGDDVHDGPGLIGDAQTGRDPGRTPMRWNARPGAGFTPDDVRPWLPIGDAARDQRRGPARGPGFDAPPVPRPDRPATRDAGPAFGRLRLVALARRGLGLAPRPRTSKSPSICPTRQRRLSTGRGTIVIGTDRARDGERVEGDLESRAVGGSGAARRSRLSRTRWSARPTLVNGRIGASRTAASGTRRTVTKAHAVTTNTARILAFHGRSTSVRRATMPPAPIPATKPVTASAASAEMGMPISQGQPHRLGNRPGRARVLRGEGEDDEDERHEHQPERDPQARARDASGSRPMRRRPRRSAAPRRPA